MYCGGNFFCDGIGVFYVVGVGFFVGGGVDQSGIVWLYGLLRVGVFGCIGINGDCLGEFVVGVNEGFL